MPMPSASTMGPATGTDACATLALWGMAAPVRQSEVRFGHEAMDDITVTYGQM